MNTVVVVLVVAAAAVVVEDDEFFLFFCPLFFPLFLLSSLMVPIGTEFPADPPFGNFTFLY